MRRPTRTLLFLIALAVALAVIVFAQIRHEQALAYDPLTTLDLAAVHTLIVRCDGCTTRRFEKVAGHWRMREPLDRAADESAVDKLLSIARAPVRFRHAAGELDGARLGLDPPMATLQLDALVFKFGATDAINGDRYVQVGTTIALVPDHFSATLFATPGEQDSPASPPPTAK